MPATAQYLSILSVEPKIDQTDVLQRPDLKVRFNMAVDTAYVSVDAELNKYVILVRQDTDQAVPVTYVGWDSLQKLLTFRPAADLDQGALYQVTLLKSLRNSQGRAMLQDRNWAFRVGDGDVGIPALLEPGDSTAFATAPALSWEGVVPDPVGPVTYELELAEDWEFTTLLWSTSVTDNAPEADETHSVAIGVSLTANRAYYWRLRAVLPGAEPLLGAWSETRVFWLGTAATVSPDPALSYQAPPDFQLLSATPETGATQLADWPALSATFSLPLAPDTVTTGTVRLLALPVDGRMDVAEAALAGTVEADGATLNFTPDPEAAIQPNTRYLFRITRDVKSTTGDSLFETLDVLFTGPFSPLYGALRGVRVELGGFVKQLPDEELLFHLWRSSLEVNNLLIRQLRRSWTRAVNPLNQESLDEVIAYQAAKVTWGMTRWCELAAAVSLLESHYFDVLSEAGRQTILGPFAHKVEVELLEELRAAIKEKKRELDQLAAQFLAALVVPRTVIQGQYFDPTSPLARDWSYDGPDGDDGFRRSSF